MRELQRVTGSIIKLPEHGLVPPADEETTVHIIGHFFSVQVCVFVWCGSRVHRSSKSRVPFSFASQSAQRRIRAMMLSTIPPPVPKRTAQRTASSPQQASQQTPVAAAAAAAAPQPQQPAVGQTASPAAVATAATAATSTVAGPLPSTSSQ